MDGQVAVSVIIPARNAAPTIGRQLAALAAQRTSRRFEVIVVDNGSTDNTAAVATEFAPRMDLRVVVGPTAPNRSLARNLGADHARGDLLAFCDADDEVQPGWLEALCQAAADTPVVTGSLVRIDEGVVGQDSTPSQPTFRGIPTLASGNFAIQRSLFQELGGFDPSVLHRVDTELTCRLYASGISVIYAPDARIHYYRRGSLGGEMRQMYHWSVAAASIYKTHRTHVPFSYSWRNSLKQWLLLLPRFVTGCRHPLRRRSVALTLAALWGQVVGSVRHRTLYL